MQNEYFEWDDGKADANLRKHGVSFDEACTIFGDDYLLSFPDERKDYGEQRYFAYGTSAYGRMLTVIWTYRNNRYRLISAFVPEPNQRKIYEKRRYRHRNR